MSKSAFWTALSAALFLGIATPAWAVTCSVTGSQTLQTLHPGDPNAVCFKVTITSSHILPVTLQSIRFKNLSAGSGTQAQLDPELGSPGLYRDTGSGAFEAGTDPLQKQSTASGGYLLFSGLNVNVPALGSVTLFVVTDIPTAVRDGDNLDLQIEAASDIVFSTALAATNSFPVTPAGSIALDGSSAAQYTVVGVGPGNVLAGTNNNLMLDVRIPANGYQTPPDVLQKIAVQNEGTATLASDLGTVRAWVDDGNGSFNPTVDRLLGVMSFTGDRWQVTGLAENIPLGGLRIFVTVDVKDFATDGRTIRFAIPWLPDPGVGVASSNDGPIDQVVRNPAFLTVSTADRITLGATAVPSPTVRPGQTGVPLADFTVQNSYAVSKTLTQISFTNETTGPGSQSDLDHEMDRVSLWYDANPNGALDTLDSFLGSASFQNGEATFSGLTRSFAPGTTRHLFLTGDVSLAGARDGDLLGTSIQNVSQVFFDDSTRVVAGLPLDSGARPVVDGMIAAQTTVFPTPSVTLGKNEGPARVFDFLLPRNGYQSDVLNGLDVINLGTAGNADLAEVRLWKDGGDGQFTPGSGDDSDLGALAWQINRWRAVGLTAALGATGGRFFVSIKVSNAPVDSSTVRLAIPVGGVTVASGNDGPLDAQIVATNTALLSNAPLLVSLEILPHQSTVGQSVSATMAVRNVAAETVNGITPSALIQSGTGSFTFASGPLPASFNLAPGAADTFHWVYTAATAGNVTLRGSAGGTGSPSGSPRNGLPSTSNTHQVFTQTQSISFSETSSLPAAVNRGQQNVSAASLVFTNPGGAQSSTVRLFGMRFRVEDGNAAPIVPSSLLGKVTVTEGGNTLLTKTALETSGSVIDLAFASPASIPAGASVTLDVTLDVLSSTTVPEFRLSITDSTVFTARDANSGAPVSVTQSGSYPVRTAVTRVVAAATELDLAGAAGTVNRVGRGKTGADLLQFQLQSPGITGITSDVRLFGFAAVLEDTNGAVVPRPADFLSFIRVESGFQTLVARAVSSAEGPALNLVLSLPLNVPANTPVDVIVRGDVSGSSSLGTVRLRMLDPPTVDARDANTRDPVPAVYTPATIVGNTLVVEARADSLRAAGTALFPPRATIGATGVTALRARLRHPGPAGTGRIAVDAISVQCRDESRRPLAPSAYLSRVAVFWNGAFMAENANPPGSGAVTITLPRPLLEPGEIDSLDLVVDFSAAAPEGSIELMVFADGVPAEDLNLGTPVTLGAESGADLPMLSGLCRLETPPRDLVVDLQSLMPAALAPDGRAVTAGILALTNAAQPGSDSILVDHLTLLGADRALGAAAVGQAASRVEIYRQGVLIAQSATLTLDSVSAYIAFAPAVRVPPGPAGVALEVRWVTAVQGYPATFRMGCDAAGIGVVQPASALLQVRVAPAQGKTFPLWSGAGVFGGAGLRESYSNFPNPFAAGRGATSFAYYLKNTGRVTLRILTPGGEGVTTVVSNEARPAGMNQSDLWDGRNGSGSVVRNGVYIAELTVSYDDGSRDRVRRKVAVVR